MKKRLSPLFLTVLSLIIVSCGKDPKVLSQEDNTATSSEAVIVGDVDWRDIKKTNRHEREAAHPVGILNIPAISSRCTAFMITDSVAMTNNHCIRNKRDARRAEITFNYSSSRSDKKKYRCSKFLHTNKELDYTLLECRDKPGAKHGKVTFTNRKSFVVGESILVTHYNCDYYNDYYCSPYLKFSSGKVVGESQTYNKLYYDADTLGGSSGSPVFYQNPKDEKYYLVALHNKGYGNGNDDGRGRYNSGVLAPRLVEDLNRYFQSRR